MRTDHLLRANAVVQFAVNQELCFNLLSTKVSFFAKELTYGLTRWRPHQFIALIKIYSLANNLSIVDN